MCLAQVIRARHLAAVRLLPGPRQAGLLRLRRPAASAPAFLGWPPCLRAFALASDYSILLECSSASVVIYMGSAVGTNTSSWPLLLQSGLKG